MPIGPEDIERAIFKERFRGYDQGEVDRFLDRVAAGVAELAAERDALVAELTALRANGAPVAAPAMDDADEMLRRTLGTARQTAEELLAAARRQAEELTAEARRQAERERVRVEVDADRVRQAVEQLRRFRDDYRARLHTVVSEQLSALDRAGELPRIPPAVDEVITRIPAPAPKPAPPRDAVEAGWAAGDEEHEDTGELAPAPWEDAWDDPWAAPEPAAGTRGDAGEP